MHLKLGMYQIPNGITKAQVKTKAQMPNKVMLRSCAASQKGRLEKSDGELFEF